MIQSKWEYAEAILGFSCLKMKQEIQEKIYQETEGITKQEFLAYIPKEVKSIAKKLNRIEKRS